MKTNVKYHAIIFQIQCIQIQERVALKKKPIVFNGLLLSLCFKFKSNN